jgi:hypothetical protein
VRFDEELTEQSPVRDTQFDIAIKQRAP